MIWMFVSLIDFPNFGIIAVRTYMNDTVKDCMHQIYQILCFFFFRFPFFYFPFRCACYLNGSEILLKERIKSI